jgi:hypothetical protein
VLLHARQDATAAPGAQLLVYCYWREWRAEGNGHFVHFVASTDMWAGAAEKIEKVMQNDAF